MKQGCNNLRVEGKNYCSYHLSVDLTYSAAEIEETLKMAYDYCDALVLKYDDILEIKDIKEGGKNEIGRLYFYCTLITNDSTKMARIIIGKSDYENMEVNGLEYEKEDDSWKWDLKHIIY